MSAARCQLSALSFRTGDVISAVSSSKTSLQNAKKSRIKNLSFIVFVEKDDAILLARAAMLLHRTQCVRRFALFHLFFSQLICKKKSVFQQSVIVFSFNLPVCRDQADCR
jgi:hypothetical protein